jgi:heme-degrading monooxygenase HmoA
VIAISRFDSAADDAEQRGRTVLDALSGRPGFRRGRLARAVDEPTAWVLTSEWDSVGSYRRGISAYEVKLVATTLLAEGRDEVSAFEVVHAVDAGQPPAPPPSERARAGS